MSTEGKDERPTLNGDPATMQLECPGLLLFSFVTVWQKHQSKQRKPHVVRHDQLHANGLGPNRMCIIFQFHNAGHINTVTRENILFVTVFVALGWYLLDSSEAIRDCTCLEH